MPAAPVALAFASGIAIAPWAHPDVAWTAWLASLAIAGALLLAGRTASAAAPLLVGVVAVGAVHGIEPPLPRDHIARLELPRIARVDARLAAEPVRWAPDRLRLLIDVERVDDVPRSGRVQVAVYGVPPPLAKGQRIAAELSLYPATGLRNPGTFDYAESLGREGIRVTATARADRLEPVDDATPPWPARIKRRSLAAISLALPPASAALLAGLLLGERSDLPRELDDGFRRAGVYHVLAVSGFNVVLLAAPALALCRLARVGRRAAAVAAPMPRGVMAGAIAVSAAAQLAVLPIALTHFNQLSTIGVVANLAVVPLAGVATVAGLLAVGLSFLSASAAQVGFDALWPVLLALRGVVALAAAVPGAVVHLPAPPWVAIVCYAASLALGLVWWHLREKRPRVGRPSGAAAL